MAVEGEKGDGRGDDFVMGRRMVGRGMKAREGGGME